jgi:protein TonB
MDVTSIQSVADHADGATKAFAAGGHGYALSVQAAIGPKQLSGGGAQGRVLVAFSLSGNGALAAVRIAQSSGDARLDRQAMEIVSRASFPTPPTGMYMASKIFLSAFTFS